MTRAQALETVAGLLLVGGAASAWVGWPPVAAALGGILLLGVVIQVARRHFPRAW